MAAVSEADQVSKQVITAIVTILHLREILPDWFFTKDRTELSQLHDKLQEDIPDAIKMRYSPSIRIVVKNKAGQKYEKWKLNVNASNEIKIEVHSRANNGKAVKIEYTPYKSVYAIKKQIHRILRDFDSLDIPCSDLGFELEIKYGRDSPETYIPPTLRTQDKT